MTRRRTYTHPDLIVPWLYGYCVVHAGGQAEIWHYAGDYLVHVCDELDAVGWCMKNPAVPNLPPHLAKRGWIGTEPKEDRYDARPRRYRP